MGSLIAKHLAKRLFTGDPIAMKKVLLKSLSSEDGFTLIELLVSIIIISILAAIALPSFLNQAAKAKQSEAKNYVGSVNRAQQAYRIENPTFADTVDDLELGLPTETKNYRYDLIPPTDVRGGINATPIDPESLKSYTGDVFVLDNGQSAAIMCESEEVNTQIARPADSETCGDGYKKL